MEGERPRIVILSAAGDEAWREAAMGALGNYLADAAPLPPGGGLEAAACVVVLWSVRAAVALAPASSLPPACDAVVVWRIDDAPVPAVFRSAIPVDASMGPRALRLVVKFTLDEAARRRRSPPRRRPWVRRILLAAGAIASVAVAAAGVSIQMAIAGKPQAASSPVTGLRGLQRDIVK